MRLYSLFIAYMAIGTDNLRIQFICQTQIDRTLRERSHLFAVREPLTALNIESESWPFVLDFVLIET